MQTEKKPGPERGQTDASLRTERENTDRALSEQQAIVEEDADAVIRRARSTADAVLVAARQKADELQSPMVGQAQRRGSIAEERGVEDATLRTERAIADATLRRERAETAAALSKLLPLERAKTDRYLLTERLVSDDAVSNRDDFLGIVSHDLRNLLGGIVIDAGLLSMRASDDEEGRKTLSATARIQRYAAHMNRLIGDLVDVAAIDAGRLTVFPVPGDGAALTSEAVDMFQGAATAKSISLRAELGAATLPTRFDRERILQVFANLITNAIKFTGESGTIVAAAKPTGEGLQFSVADSGCGVPVDMLESIFDRFCQVSKNDRRGVGLGLYISRCIVEAHGGKIWAESEEGVGTTLHFTLPDIAAQPNVAPL